MKIELPNNGFIEATEIVLGKNVTFGKDVKINVKGVFKVGDNSHIGDRFNAIAENILIGNDFYNQPTDSRGMVIGGGGSNFPFANLTIGDRCVCHTGHINLARSVKIGNDVGLSHDVDILTHGFWASVLEGYPSIFADVIIGNNVIMGWKSLIMAGVTIADDVVVGANSTVVKSLTESRGIYAGSPAKFIKKIQETTIPRKIEILNDICAQFKELMNYYKESILHMEVDYPIVRINNLVLNTVTLEYNGEHDTVTDAFRDFLRRQGIRIFCGERKFSFSLTRK